MTPDEEDQLAISLELDQLPVVAIDYLTIAFAPDTIKVFKRTNKG